MTGSMPAVRPARPFFSSGPCAKRPGWTPDSLKNAVLGRSHRSKTGKARLQEAIDRTRAVLGVPADYRIGIVPASDTGAVEIALWSLLGPRPIDMLAWESFGKDWITDVVKQLKLEARQLTAPYGELPDLTQVNPAHDVVFTWNGTTSGVRVPDANWIAADRQGLTICDATSAAFAQDLDWGKLDVVTFSWQKVLGGEGAHGMLILSPRAVERLENHKPQWPMPKIFRLTKDGKIVEGIFKGETINTPSMLCVEDYVDALKWAEEIGGLGALMARADESLRIIERHVNQSSVFGFLCADKKARSNTSVCLVIKDADIAARSADDQAAFAKKVADLLEKEGVAFDIGGYRDAPAGLRIWCGATVDPADIETLMPWLDWAVAKAKSN